MISIFRRLGNATTVTTTVVPLDPGTYWVDEAPEIAPAVPDPAMGEILHLRAQLDQERRYRALAQQEAAAAVRRARDAECDLQAVTARLALTSGDGAAAEMARMRRTLTIQDDLLAGCRRDHGSNIRASSTGSADRDAPYAEIAAIKRREDA